MIGNGSPLAFPDPSPVRDIDVVTMLDNRWAPLAEPVTEQLTAAGIDCLGVTAVDNERVLQAFGRARVLLHPARIEGHSRITCEARAMGAVPVGLDTQRFAVGLDEAGGAVTVGAPSEMGAAVAALLRDRDRLKQLSATAMASARRQVEWEPYVRRVAAALASEPEDRARASRAAVGAALREGRDRNSQGGPRRARAAG